MSTFLLLTAALGLNPLIASPTVLIPIVETAFIILVSEIRTVICHGCFVPACALLLFFLLCILIDCASTYYITKSQPLKKQVTRYKVKKPSFCRAFD
jgi:hypothetical protein